MSEMNEAAEDFDENDEDIGPDIEIVDDTPDEDKGKTPMPKEIVEELDNDELEEYSGKVKEQMKKLKKVWHDERREKERIQREAQEAISFAQRVNEDNRRLRGTLSEGEKILLQSLKNAAAAEAAKAERDFRDAQDDGDPDKIVEAQRHFTDTRYRVNELNRYNPPLQQENYTVQQQSGPQYQAPVPDEKAKNWQNRNGWYGTDKEMTASALGLHQKLFEERGEQFVGSDEYWELIDKTMARRFPEYFGEDNEAASGSPPARRDGKADTVVAPAARSRAPRKVRLTTTEVSLAKKLGLTPEQYAKEKVKLEN